MASVQKNTILNIIKTLCGVIFPFITFPYISRILHAENLGKINFGNSIISYFSLLASLGISTYAIRECSKVKDNPEKYSQTASQLFSINLISTFFSYCVLFCLLFFVRKFDGYRILILIQSLSVFFTTIGAEWINAVNEDFKFITIRSIVFQIFSILLMFIFVHAPEHYLIYAGIGVIASSGASLVNIIYRKKKNIRLKFSLNLNLKKHAVPIFMLFGMAVFSIIYTNVDITMLGIMKGDNEVGFYSSAVKIYNIVNVTIASIAAVVLPQLSYNFEKKNFEEINNLISYALRFIVILGIPAIVGINTISEEIIFIMAGKEFLSAAVPLRILTISLFFSLLGGLVGNMILVPSGREKICLISTGFSAFINFVLNIFFIKYWGMIGASITTAISECFAFFFGVFFINKEIRIVNIKDILLGPLLGSSIIVLISFLIKYFVSDMYLRAVIIICLSVFSYSIFLIITKNSLMLNFLNAGLKRFRR